MPEIAEETARRIIDLFGDGMTADMIGPRFTCTEAERVADLLRELGDVKAANSWLWGHAHGDDDPESDTHPLDVCKACGERLRGDGTASGRDGLRWVTFDGVAVCAAATAEPREHIPTHYEA